MITRRIEDAKTIIGVMLAAPRVGPSMLEAAYLQSECCQLQSVNTAFPIDPFRTTYTLLFTVPNPDETSALPTLEDPVPTSPFQVKYQYQYPDPIIPPGELAALFSFGLQALS